MINRNLYAFVTGVHFGVLQIAYLLILQLSISSTYLTYMVIVMSWMVGAAVGLWWKRVHTELGLCAGLVSYYLIYLLAGFAPPSRLTLLVSALGVAITGIWAGRFFIVMQPLFRRVDGMFFHENNGFFVGVVTVFIGFTLTGLPFLLWAPLVTATTLVVQARWVTGMQLRWVTPVLLCMACGLAVMLST